jgi:anti-sigma regulatory factor (Ser/Thr protein kinase)
MITSAQRAGAVRQLLSRAESVANRDVADLLGVSAATAQRVLRAMVDDDLLRVTGRGRSARYTLKPVRRRYPLPPAADESVIWDQVEEELERLTPLNKVERDVLRYAATEMINNAIDHSGGSRLQVSAHVSAGHVEVEIQDNDVGALKRARAGMPTLTPREVVLELEKGKLTTDPARHTGQGLFFTSKAVSRFKLESEGVAWIVDNALADSAIASSTLTQGTRITLTLVLGQTKPLKDTFDAWTDPETLRFHRTRTTVHLAQTGTTFVSRSEAKRVAARLEAFQEVIVDFDQVELVGQGFCDELFRVWATAHPRTTLLPVRMNDDVAFMVQRARTPG